MIQEGRESGQGVAYMDDGTMVVVENGREYMEKDITVMVTKVLADCRRAHDLCPPGN